MLNECNISCRNLVVFTMDEWADQDGRIAPESYPADSQMRFSVSL